MIGKLERVCCLKKVCVLFGKGVCCLEKVFFDLVEEMLSQVEEHPLKQEKNQFSK